MTAATPILFTAHSIPLGMSENCRYVAQLEEACRLVAEGTGHARWELVYQSRSGPPSQPWHLIFLAAAGLAALLMIIRIILGGRSELGIDLDRGFGMYVGAIAAIVAAAGAFLNFQAAGGELSDLTDMDKLKDAFDGDQGGTPPPPPPPAQ